MDLEYFNAVVFPENKEIVKKLLKERGFKYEKCAMGRGSRTNGYSNPNAVVNFYFTISFGEASCGCYYADGRLEEMLDHYVGLLPA